jgi:nucleoid-associated protein YgaU
MALSSLLLTPEKAKIKIYDPATSGSSTDELECMFRPNKISHSKGSTWTSTPGAQKEVPISKYGGGQPQKWTLELFFDTTDSGVDVRTKYINKLMKLVKQGSSKEPPACEFTWGSISTGKCYVESLSVDYTLFLPSGKPIRAEVSGVTFVEYNPTPPASSSPTNPTSRSEARETWIVHEGERLDWIAYQVYHDSAAWRHIALTNNLNNPTELRPGQILKLVPRR